MKHTKLFLIAVFLLAFMAFAVSPAVAGLVKTGIFQINVVGSEEVNYSKELNDGYESAWYLYPQDGGGGGGGGGVAAVVLPFWNEWWYNDPFIQPGGKWVQVSFNYGLINPGAAGDVHVTVNWTTPGWVGWGAPPIGGVGGNTADPEAVIERLTDYGVDWSFHLDPGAQPVLGTAGNTGCPLIIIRNGFPLMFREWAM